MGIAVFSHSFTRAPILSVLSGPLQAMLALLLPSSATLAAGEKFPGSSEADTARLARRTSDSCASVPPELLIFSDSAKKSMAPHASQARAHRLRIVREVEHDAHPCAVGRMVISGRMSDVCAELERMALREQGSYTN